MQISTGRIVVGVDGSAASLDAVHWALRQAELTGWSIEAVTAWYFPAQYGSELHIEPMDWQSIANEILDKALQEVDNKSNVSITRTITQGHPAQVLTGSSAGADLLVVGTRGHGGFAGLLLGSVSEYLVAHAHCPVVVVRHRDTE